MKTVVYESDFVEEAVMPAIGKKFINGEEVQLTDEQWEIAKTNSSIRLVETPAANADKLAASPPLEAPKPAAVTPTVPQVATETTH